MHEDDDVTEWDFKAIHNSRPPLRWIANGIFHPISMWFFKRGLIRLDHLENIKATDQETKNDLYVLICWKLYAMFDAPYEKWGTYYSTIYEEEDYS